MTEPKFSAPTGVSEDLLATGLYESVLLKGEGLVKRGDTGVANKHSTQDNAIMRAFLLISSIALFNCVICSTDPPLSG